MDAILFDLDGTLLESNFDIIIKHYFKDVSALFEDWIAQEEFIANLISSTEVMMKSEDPDRTNIEVFANDFFANTNLDPSLMSVFDRYYLEEFPKLKKIVKINPVAKDIVELAFSLHKKVVIATQPVFPLEPIAERLRWAGVFDFPYDLITHGEIMHYCKPNPNYYQEISELIGVKPEDCLMIGDDPENDGSAATIGMDVFLLQEGKNLKDALDYIVTKTRRS